MEAIITFFEPAYHSVCNTLFGQDITPLLAEKWGVQWWRVHEYLLAGFISTTIIFLSTSIILGFRLRGKINGYK